MLRGSDLIKTFPSLLTHMRGPIEQEILGLSSPVAAKAGQLIFVSDKEHFIEAQSSLAGAWVISNALKTHLEPLLQGRGLPKDLLIFSSNNVALAMALTAKRYFPVMLNKQAFSGEPIHPSAVIAQSAQIAPGVIVGPNTTIGDKVRVGQGTIIGPNTTIEAESEIGENCHIHPQVYIAYGTKIGRDCEIHPQSSIGTEGFGYAHDELGRHYRQTHYGRVILEDGVHIGAGVQIDRGTFADSLIGEGVIIDNHCHFGHNIRIGKGTIITGGLIAAGSVQIGSHCIFGGRTTIAGHLRIADRSQFAGLSGIHSSVEESGQYGGYPLVKLKDSLKMYASLPHLPKLRKHLAKVLKKLGIDPE